MKCRKCNLPIQKEDKVCPHCGAKIKRPAKLIFLSSLALILVMGVVIATFWVQDGLPNVKDQTAKQDPVSVTDSDDNDKDDKIKKKKKKKNQKKTLNNKISNPPTMKIKMLLRSQRKIITIRIKRMMNTL